MATFDFPYHRVKDVYPESSVKVSYGGGYEFASRPRGPDQVTFVLTFPAMFYYATAQQTLDLVKNPKINMGVFEKFYQDNKMYQPFTYNHPRRGAVQCRFKKPLETPDGIPGGWGQVEEFTVELILLP